MDAPGSGLEEEVNRGEQARRILEDPLVQEALTTIRARCLQEWESAPVRDVEGREKLWLMYRMSKQFEEHLSAVIETGRLASKSVAEQDKRFGIFKR